MHRRSQCTWVNLPSSIPLLSPGYAGDPRVCARVECPRVRGVERSIRNLVIGVTSCDSAVFIVYNVSVTQCCEHHQHIILRHHQNLKMKRVSCSITCKESLAHILRSSVSSLPPTSFLANFSCVVNHTPSFGKTPSSSAIFSRLWRSSQLFLPFSSFSSFKVRVVVTFLLQ